MPPLPPAAGPSGPPRRSTARPTPCRWTFPRSAPTSTAATACAGRCSACAAPPTRCQDFVAPRIVTTLVAIAIVIGVGRSSSDQRMSGHRTAAAGARRAGSGRQASSTPRAAPLEPPIRSEIFGPERFAQHGRSLGETHRAGTSRAGARRRSSRACATTSASLREAHRYIGAQATTGYDVSPAAEWLLDNFHLIEAQLKRDPRRPAAALLPRPAGAAGRAAGRPAARLRRRLGLRRAHRQRVRRGAADALPERLPGDARADAGRAVGAADHLARRAGREPAPPGRARRHEQGGARGRQPCAATASRATRLRAPRRSAGAAATGAASATPSWRSWRSACRTTRAGPIARLPRWLRRRRCPTSPRSQTQQPAEQAADNLSVSNAITSLRSIGDADWPDIVARTSALDAAAADRRRRSRPSATTRATRRCTRSSCWRGAAAAASAPWRRRCST